MAKDIIIAIPGDDLSDEAALTSIRPRADGAQGIFLFGANAAQSEHNWIEDAASGAISGSPLYGSGYVRLNGDDTAQSRLDTRIKQSTTNTLYAVFRPASATIDPLSQPVIFSTGLGYAVNNQNEAGNRTSNGIALYASQDGYLTLSVVSYNPTTASSQPVVFAMTGIDYSIWHLFCVVIDGSTVQIIDLTTGAQAQRTVADGYVVDPNQNTIIWGDSASAQTVRDGIGDFGIAGIFNVAHDADERSAMYGQFKARMALASPGIDI